MSWRLMPFGEQWRLAELLAGAVRMGGPWLCEGESLIAVL